MKKANSKKKPDESTLAMFMKKKVSKADAETARTKYAKQEKQGKVLEAIFYTEGEVKKFICEIFPLIEKYAHRIIQLPNDESFELSVGYYPVMDKHDNKWKLNILTGPVITHNISKSKNPKYGIWSYAKAPESIKTFFDDLWRFSLNKKITAQSEEDAMGVYNFGDRHP